MRLEIGRYDWGANMAEFIAIGTAIVRTDAEPPITVLDLNDPR